MIDTSGRLAKFDGRSVHWVRRYEGERFSVVTAFKMQFHTTAAAATEQEPAGKHAKRRNLRRWGRHEWEYFLGELSLHHLQPHRGVVVL